MIKHKRKYCEICGSPVYKTTARVCSVTCALEYNLKNPDKIRTYLQTLEAKEWKQKKKVLKEKLKSLSELEKDAKKAFQKWIRLRDQGKPCISCGAKLTQNGTHASHYFAAGMYSGLIFDDRNCHSSCVQCNTWLHGNLINYRIGLVKRYGNAYVDELEMLAVSKRDHKYTKQELKDLATKYKQKIKQ